MVATLFVSFLANGRDADGVRVASGCVAVFGGAVVVGCSERRSNGGMGRVGGTANASDGTAYPQVCRLAVAASREADL